MHLAILFHAFTKLVSKGFTPIIPPSIVKGFTLFGTGQFPWGEKEVYKLNGEDSYLQGTAEVPITAYHSGETFNENELIENVTQTVKEMLKIDLMIIKNEVDN